MNVNFIRMSFLLLVGLVLNLNLGCWGYPLGAPLFACDTVRPGHGVLPQTSEAPFKIVLDPPERQFFKPGEEIKVTISPQWGNNPFKGFLLQARTTNETNSKIVGQFRKHISYIHTTKLACQEGNHSALCHSVQNQFWRVSGMWQGPQDFHGDIVFVAAVVKKYEIFWTGIRSHHLKPLPDPTTSPPPSLNMTNLCQKFLLEDIPSQRPHVAIMCGTSSDCPCGWRCCSPCDITACGEYSICRKPIGTNVGLVVDENKKDATEVMEEEGEGQGTIGEEVEARSIELEEV